MSLNFPSNPTPNQIYTLNDKTWVWNGEGWQLQGYGTSGGDTVTIAASAADVLSATSGEISADDAGTDKLVFWDDSQGKLTHLALGDNLSITDTTLNAAGGNNAIGGALYLNATCI